MLKAAFLMIISIIFGLIMGYDIGKTSKKDLIKKLDKATSKLATVAIHNHKIEIERITGKEYDPKDYAKKLARDSGFRIAKTCAKLYNSKES